MKFLWLAPVVIVADQFTKRIIQTSMALQESTPVLGDFFRLTYIHNAGAAFGLKIGSPFVHTAISVVALFALVWLFRSVPSDNRIMRPALSMVLGGALGNIIDRIRLGMVVDFFDVGIGTLRWPVFNVADSCVTIGILLIALSYLQQRPHKEVAPSDSDPEPEPTG